MKDYQIKDMFDLFDDKEPALEDKQEETPDLIPAAPIKETGSKEGEEKRKKKKKPRKKKTDGVFVLPVYKAAFDSYKECRFRFRKVSGDGKAIAREVTANLKRIMVDIELVYWQVKPKSILPDTFALVLETIIVIRAMKDFGDLSTKDYGIISQYTSKLSVNMRIWSEFHNTSDDNKNPQE